MAATDSKHDGLAGDARALGARVRELEEELTRLRAREDERKRAETSLLLAKRELEDSNQAKSEFLARMSHELRTPLNSILGFSQVLNTDPDEPLTQSQRESVRQILKAGWHLLALINEVLDLARIESGKLQLSIESVSVEQIVREALTLIAPVAEKHQIKVIDETKALRQLYVTADRTRLKQVLLNLLSNGVKYNKSGGSVTLTCARQGDARLVVAVSDTGAGLTREEQAMLFTPFTRIRARADVEGTGMGLAITRRLIELMGGTIGVESVPGSGSRFFFELGIGEKPAAPWGDETDPSLIIARTDANVATLLHVEDNPANRALVARILERRPHISILAADTAEKGLELARTRDPDLIVLDINLPSMDGFEALELLRSYPDTRNIPVIALSANAMPSDVKRGLEAGFLQYLTKPIDVKEFLRTIDLFSPVRTRANHPPRNRRPPSPGRLEHGRMLTAEEITKGRILVVDDTESHVILLRKILKGAGYLSIATTTDPEEAVALYKEFQPDLLVLDLHMSPIDGFQILDQLKVLEPADSYVPALMMTALSDPDVLVKALERGARDFLNKPFERVEALTRIRNMLEVRLMHKQVRDQNRILEETVSARTREIRETRLEVIRRLGRAAEYRDNETGMHIIRMSLAASILGRAAGMSPEQCELLLNASPMHDIGKIGIPDRILLKAGPLDGEEWAIMRRHPTIGAELLSGGSSELMQLAEVIAHCHHEKFDGTGYPRGLEGEQIPKAARIVAVCDVFDALLSKRPYKAPWTVEAALEELDKRAGTHFDPELVAKFHDVLGEVLGIHARYADDHESASQVIRASVKLKAGGALPGK